MSCPVRPNLYARLDIGEADRPLASIVGHIEGVSIEGTVWVSNTGALTVGGVVDGDDPGMAAGGGVNLSANSPLTVDEDVIAPGPITLIAVDSPGAGDNLTVQAGITVRSTGVEVNLLASRATGFNDGYARALAGVEIVIGGSGGDFITGGR